MRACYRLRPARYGWQLDDPDDPDFFVEFAAPANQRVRVRAVWFIRVALRVVNKPLLVVNSLHSDEQMVRVILGLTIVRRVFGRWLDHQLARFIVAELTDLDEEPL